MLIQSGIVDLISKNKNKFMQLPPHSMFNDYQIMFGLKSNIKFKSWSPVFENEVQLSQSELENKTRTMNLDAQVLRDLLELYPETAKNLKLRALEKRSIFVYYKNKADMRRKKLNG